jgi:1-acyl-sn-glycerol-3-phosphate acyltransferase
MNTDFRPPKTHPLALGLVYPCLPAIARLARRIVAIEVVEQDWEQLLRLRERRLILTPNHPSSNDPLIALWMARKLGRAFNYLACRELFEGLYGWVLQRLGCYSVLRGAMDREAVRTTISLLAEQDRQVVIFPEGEIYGHNDMLLPFQAGVVQMGFMAVDRLEKAGKDRALPVVPAAVKYLHVMDAHGMINENLARLERDLGIKEPLADDYQRLRRIGWAVLTSLEREYRLNPGEEQSAAVRADLVKREILKRVAEAINVPCPTGAFAEGLHSLLSASHEYADEFAGLETAYGQRLYRRRLRAVVPLYQDLWRLQNMLAVTDGYVAAHMTTERFCEVLNRLEVEVIGKPRTRVPSRALIRIAEPLDLGDRFPDYRQSRRATITGATAELEGRMRAMLDELSAMGRAF